VTGASGNIANHLLFMLASGEVYGKDQPLSLMLLGSERSYGALEGVAMVHYHEAFMITGCSIEQLQMNI
jgi:hypothetical protein